MIIRPMPVPPPVTTAERFETWKRFEALSSSLDLAEGLSDAIACIMLKLVYLGRVLRVRLEVGLVSSLSIMGFDALLGATVGRHLLLGHHDVRYLHDVVAPTREVRAYAGEIMAKHIHMLRTESQCDGGVT